MSFRCNAVFSSELNNVWLNTQLALLYVITVWAVYSGYNCVGTANCRSDCKSGAMCIYTVWGKEFKHSLAKTR